MTTTVVPAIRNFAFEEYLVRTLLRDGEPWFVAIDVCRALELKGDAGQHTRTIEDVDKALIGIQGVGGEQKTSIISLAAVFALIFKSRKDGALRFQRWVTHVVLPAIWKNGHYEVPDDDTPEPLADPAGEAMLHRLHVIREARILFGPERARSLWRQLGLPAVPPPPAGPVEEARACLRHLLDHPAHEGGPRVRDLLALALDDDEEARLLLIGCGVRVMPELDAFSVANQHPRLQQIFKPTPWCGTLGWMRVLRRLPGVEAGGQSRWPGPYTSGSPVMRSTLLKGDWLDADA